MIAGNAHSRRGFLARSAGAGAACALARFAVADDVATQPASFRALDTHVYVGRWPFARLTGDEPKDLVAMLRDARASSAWAGSFDGLFHKDIASVNARLAEACAKFGGGVLKPFGTVNPTLPDWEDDIRLCHETHHMLGIRLHPNYHGYGLDDPRFVRLLGLAAGRGLTVQIVAWLEDQPRKWLRPRAARVELKPLADAANKVPNARIVVADGVRDVDDPTFRELARLKQVSFDIGALQDVDDIDRLVEATSKERVLFGSGAPLYPKHQSTN